MSSKKETLALAISQTAAEIQKAFRTNDLAFLWKENVEMFAKDLLPADLQEKVVFTADNWNPDNIGRYPDLTSSIALREVDKDGNIISCAIAPARDVWQHQAVVAVKSEGVFIASNDDLIQVKSVDDRLMYWLPCESVIFGKKATQHWVEMNHVVGRLNSMGIRTANDCGPYFAMKEWFTIVTPEGIITPSNVAYVEPYLLKPKEELIAWLVACLNETLPSRQQFILTDLAGSPLLREGSYHGEEGVGIYQGVGFVAIPFRKSYMVFMDYLRKAVQEVTSFDQPENTKMAQFAASLRNWR